MRIKSRLRNWLDIKEPKAPLTAIDLRPLICRALVDIIEGKPSEYYTHNDGVNAFVQALEKAAYKTANQTANTAVMQGLKKVETEEFIDKIIERIKRKQLS